MTSPTEKVSYELKRADQVMGRLFVHDTDFPWLLCNFEATDAFEEVRPFFEEANRLQDHTQENLNNEEYVRASDAWFNALEKLSTLNLYLEQPGTGKIIREFLLHIRERDAELKVSPYE